MFCGPGGSAHSESAGLTHQALFYRDDATYLDAIVPFVRDGLARGEPVAVAVPGARLEAVRRALGRSAADVLMLDMADAGRNPGAILGGVLRDFADNHAGRPRMVGEPIWAERSAVEYTAALEHEALINDAFAGRCATVLCPYDLTALAPSTLADAASTHPELVDETGTRASEAYAPAEVVDGCNHPLPAPPGVRAFRFDLHTLAEARHVATRHAELSGLPGERIDDVAVVVGELTANSVQHAGGSGTLRLWCEAADGATAATDADRGAATTGGAFVCQVDDAGRNTDPLAGRIPASPRQLGGRGLLLVHRLADLVRTHRGADRTSTRAWFRG